MGHSISVNSIGYTLIMLSFGITIGFYAREIIYNAVNGSKPKKRNRPPVPRSSDDPSTK